MGLAGPVSSWKRGLACWEGEAPAEPGSGGSAGASPSRRAAFATPARREPRPPGWLSFPLVRFVQGVCPTTADGTVVAMASSGGTPLRWKSRPGNGVPLVNRAPAGLPARCRSCYKCREHGWARLLSLLGYTMVTDNDGARATTGERTQR